MTPEVAADRGQLALELAAMFAGRADSFEAFIDGHDVTFEEWLWNLPSGMDRAGQVDDVVAVADDLGGMDARYDRT